MKKKAKLIRYDLDRVYYLKGYQKAVAHAEQNIEIPGMKEQLNDLKAEKGRYSKEVSALVEVERDNERQKYEKYEKWETIAQISKRVFLVGLAICVLSWFVPNSIRHTLSLLFGTLAPLALLVGGPVTIITYLLGMWHRQQYQRYKDGLSDKIDSLGKAFTKVSEGYYHTIDSLYLNSLDPQQRQFELMRREQAAQNQKLIQAQEETQRLQKKLIVEQQKTRATQEELLAIERDREERYKSRR
ncbi:MAG: hypothetical protein HFF06_03640 [Oscillospiraceae bacterium]|jgi:hypothetical protein|nr:hypothetical protein [Oscillospiraceae bacterium]